MKPVRVRKARNSGTCPECRRYVRVGDLIASFNGGPFVCLKHIGRADTDGPRKDVRPAQGGPAITQEELSHGDNAGRDPAPPRTR